MRDQWDWTAHTSYEFRTGRIRSRFRYRFVRELFDLTMEQAIAFLQKRQREIDVLFGSDPRRARQVAGMVDVLRKAGADGVGGISEFVARVSTRDLAIAFTERAGVDRDALKMTFAEIDTVVLPTQKSMRLLVPKGDLTRNAHIDALLRQGLGNNLALLDAARAPDQRARLAARLAFRRRRCSS